MFATPANAAVPAGFEDTLVARAGGATAIAFTPDGRLLIAQRAGELRIVKGGTLLPTPALSIASKTCSDSERGLLGVAVDPDFASNGHVYLYYTYKKTGTCEYRTPNVPVNRVSRFTLGGNDLIAPSSEVVLVDNIPSYGGNHNAGALEFGKDNYLYVAVGDGGCDYGGSGCGPANDAARETHTLLGKILRITPTGGIPTDNPFRGLNSARCAASGRTDPGKVCQEIYATGLRNPFRLGFDPNAATTRFFINDVGQETWEEIDVGQAGADYGWNVREGNCATGSTTNCGAPPAGLTNPLYSYGRGGGCTSITGGAFVPNRVWPAAYDGSYLFGDYGCGQIRRLYLGGSGVTSTEFGTGIGAPVDLTFGPYAGGQALYYAVYKPSGDEVRRVAYTGNRAPVASMVIAPRDGPAPLVVLYDGRASSDPDGDALSYDWDFGDGTAHSSAAAGAHTYTAAGTYTARLRVTDSRGASVTETLRIDVGNGPPVPRIDLPLPTTRFRVGETITLRGSATDPQDGTVPDSRLSWTVRLRHNSHTHPFLSRTGNNITFSAPPPENLVAAATSYLEVELTATDSRGLSRAVSQDLRPRTVALTFATNPTGRRLVIDGSSVTAPASFTSWEGYSFGVDAPVQVDGSVGWQPSSWSDGGAAAHTITTPASPQTFTATFSRCGGGALGASVVVLGLFGVPYLRRRRRRYS